MATSTLAPVTSFLPFEADWTCMMARWITRWNPSVGWVSTSPVPGTVGVLSPMKLVSVFRKSSMLTAHARKHFRGRWVVQKRQQQMLNGNKFMPCLPSFDKGHV